MSTLHNDHSSHLRRNESGLVAIMVTMILMIVLSLIVLGFATISRRNQRLAQDRQLNTQAFYAAESGVNDAIKVIGDAVDAGNPIVAKTSCSDTGGGFYSSLNGTLDAPTNVSYSCLMVNPAPSTLEYSAVNTRALIVPITSESGAALSQLKLVWRSKLGVANPHTTCSNGPAATANILPVTGSWTCGYGILRFDLVPTAGALTVDSLSNSAMTVFATPVNFAGGNSNMTYVPGGADAKKLVRCGSNECTLNINGLTANQYYLRVSSLYHDSSLQISATDLVGTTLNLTGAQALVDSTGKSQDILRRIQVRLPLAGSTRNRLPDYVMQSNDSICKKFSIMDGFVQNGAAPCVLP